MARPQICSEGGWEYHDDDDNDVFSGQSPRWSLLSLVPEETCDNVNAQRRVEDHLNSYLSDAIHGPSPESVKFGSSQTTDHHHERPIEQIPDHSDQRPLPEIKISLDSYLRAGSLSGLQSRNEMSFLEWYPKGGASISFQADDGRIDTINGINVDFIENRCPLLALAFEHSNSGPQLFLATLSSTTALPFVRYLYTGSYALQEVNGDVFEDVPTSVLLHCQLFRLGALYDLPELKTQAYVNVLRQCEFGCSSPNKPIDLCAAIRYMYQHLREHEQLINAVVHYCVSCFLRHRLGVDPFFCRLAYELRPFHQDLCSILRDRAFEDDTAVAIIRMPFEPYIPLSLYEDSAKHDKLASELKPSKAPAVQADVVHHFHGLEEEETTPKKRKHEDRSAADKTAPWNSATLLQLPVRMQVPAEGGLIPAEDDRENVRKRRASSAAKSLIAGDTERSKSVAERDVIQTKAAKSEASSDSGFQLVEGVHSPDVVSSDGEWEWPERTSPVNHPGNSIDDRAIPIRLRVDAGGTSDVDGFISDPESEEWTLL